MSTPPRTPLEELTPAHALGTYGAVVLSIMLAVFSVMAPPCPADAAPGATIQMADASPVPSRTASPTPSPSPAASPTPSPSPAASPTPSPSPAASPTPSPSPTASPTPSPSPTASPTPLSEQQIIAQLTEKMEHLNPSLKDWTAEVAIEARVRLSLLVLPMDLHGRSYHKAPDKYKFELQNAPALLKKYQQVFGYRPIVMSDFTATLLPEEVVDGRPTVVVRLDKRGDGDFRSQTIWIDKERFTSPRRLYLYKENGRIDVRFTWRKERDWTVIDRMEAQFDFPKVSAAATVQAKYGSYRFDSGLDDALFVETKR